MISSRPDKASMLFILCTTLAVGCGPGPDPNQPVPPPLNPLLDAVLHPGPWLRFARHTQPADVYEVLPSTSVILRMGSAYDWSTTSITIKYLSDGTTAELEQVARIDLVRRQALATQGYFEIVAGSYGYGVIVVPRADQRSGTGFDIVMVNRRSQTSQSAPLTVRVRPRVARTLPSDVFFDCGNDYDTIEGKYYTNCKPSAPIIARDITLQGWLIDPGRNCGGLCVEDWHYEFIPDPDFIETMYGRFGMVAEINGSNAAMEALVMKGNPPDTRQAGLPIRDVAPTGESRGITLNSFSLPGNHPDDHPGDPPEPDRRLCIIAELNAWHPFAQGRIWSTHWWGRGPAPAGWMTRVTNIDDPERAGESNAFWPFDPAAPDSPTPLVGGPPGTLASYVRVTGTLWQDNPHDGNGAPTASGAPWAFLDARKGAWIELHPVDWLERLPRQPAIVKTPWLFELISSVADGESKMLEMFPNPRESSEYSLRCRELVDGRLTDMSTVISHIVTLKEASVDVAVTVRSHLGEISPGDPPLQKIVPGRFKAAYIVWWEKGPPWTECRSE